MIENTEFVMSIIYFSFFTSFGLYSIIYVISSIFLKNSLIETVDRTANKLVGFIGIVYLVVWICLIVANFVNISSPQRDEILDRMFGKYWFGYWLQPALWIIMTQILRFEKIRKHKVLRFFFSVLFIYTIELYIGFLTSGIDFSNPRIHFTIMDIVLGILTKIFLFLTIVLIYYFTEEKLRNFKSRHKTIEK
jgi:hypothetical protein